MTGFGRAEGLVGERKVTVEVRSLNSKQLDLQLKVPQAFRDRDAELRQWANEKVVRGKSELTVFTEHVAGAKRDLVDANVVKAYYDSLAAVARQVDPNAKTDLLGLVLRMPEVMNPGREMGSDADWGVIRKLAEAAMDAFLAFRAAEGEKLKSDLTFRVDRISNLLVEVDSADAGRAERTRERIQGRLEELKANVDRDRFEQELVFYLEKMDINEEKVRLAAHCSYFLETMDLEEQQGRKLGFIAQEMGREINTLGSKSNDAAMQRTVVLMKDELEKIKEQVLNVL
ncbi:MAG TPA: YicC/YloC family endoribonuclease [Flavobacteriales bacterium]